MLRKMYHIDAALYVSKQILQQRIRCKYELNDAVHIFTCNAKNTPASDSEEIFSSLIPARKR